MDESTWRQFTDPHGCFRIEIPASWQVDLWDGSFTHGQHGRVWHGTRFVTELHSLVGDTNTWSTSVTIRIEQFDGTLPPIFGDIPEPTDVSFLRTRRATHDSDWLTCILGHARIHIQYAIQHMSHAYHHEDWQPPASLSPDEQHRRRAFVQRIINSFDLLASG